MHAFRLDSSSAVRLRRSGYKKSEESRRQVLDAAIATLAERGLAGTSVQDIADAAHLSKGAVHYHFESKDELYQHALVRCCETIEQRVRSAFDEPGLPMDRVRRAILQMWTARRDGAPEVRVLNEFFALARQNEAIRKALAEALQKARNQIVEVGFGRLIEMGLKPKVSVNVAARLLFGTLDGLSLHHAVDPISPEEEGELLRTIEASMLAFFEL